MKLKEKVATALSNKFGHSELFRSFADDYGFRTLILAIVAIIINVAFAAVNLVTAIIFNSAWYGVFAGYYLFIALQRSAVLITHRIIGRKCEAPEKLTAAKWKTYIANGTVFIPLDIALGFVAAYLTVYDNR